MKMHPPKIITLILLFCSFTFLAQKKSRVYVINKTGKKIYNVTVLHKYSNNYKDRITHKSLDNNKTSGHFNARYNTGFGTTGKDWWIVSWTEPYSNTQIRHRITNPKNGRAFIDGFEKGFKTSFNIGSSLLSQYGGDVLGVKGQIAGAAGKVINDQLINRTMNNSSTIGFKQHILRSEDTYLNIILYSNGVVEFKGKSGKSTTNTKSTILTPRVPTTKTKTYTKPKPKPISTSRYARTIISNKTYKLRSVKTKRYLTNRGINKHLGGVFSESSPRNGGYWRLIKVGTNYRIYNTRSRMYLANLMSKKNGTPVKQVKSPGPGALWKLSVRGGKFFIRNAQSGMYLSFYNGGTIQTKNALNLWYLEL